MTTGLADEGLEGSSDALRSEWRERSLRSLYGGRDPDMWCEDTPSGLRFIAIDNSTYQITAEQLQFFKEHAAGDHPFVLLVHIPLYLEELQEALHGTEHASVRAVSLCGDERWGAETDKGFETEQREQWTSNNPETLQFLEAVKSSGNLVAVLAGHIHSAQAQEIGGAAAGAQQLVTAASCEGGFRSIVFEPAQRAAL